MAIDEWIDARDCDCACCGCGAFTVTLTVSEDGFDGRIPGPTIEARVGDTLVLTLINRLHGPASARVSRDKAGIGGPTALIAQGGTTELRVRLDEPGVYAYQVSAGYEPAPRGLFGALIVSPGCTCCGH
jgi:FtsP/CotA-like multicopper oxidase with cupredoxin domain